jgi:hypothetical protein
VVETIIQVLALQGDPTRRAGVECLLSVQSEQEGHMPGHHPYAGLIGTRQSTFLRHALICSGLCFAVAWQAPAQDHLYMLGTTIPAEADRWYQSHYEDTFATPFEIAFATVYEAPDTNAASLGELLTRAVWEPYLHMSWVFRPAQDGHDAVWREDVGDWGYGVNQYVVSTVPGWVQLPPGPHGNTGWVRLVGYRETNGFPGNVSSVVGELLYLENVEATLLDESMETHIVEGEVLIESIESGQVTFRPEIPSDMPCGEDVDPEAEYPVMFYRAPIAHFLDENLQPRFRLAYPKGC